jgi:hypothetical protein
MINISGFLQKFLNLEKNNDVKLGLVLEIIKNETGLIIPKENLEFKSENLKINCNPVIRNEIFMHKELIEKSLKSKNIFVSLI